MDNKSIVISCEHGGDSIPYKYLYLFKNAHEILNSHRGYDLGALELFNSIKNNYIAHKQYATISRLIIDINRSPHRRSLYSEFTKHLPKNEKELIFEIYYKSFRQSFEKEITTLWSNNTCVLHLSVHSFTPVLNGVVRQTDFGILYNPERIAEKQFAQIWREELSVILPDCRTRFNYPFRGKPDGHVRYFRDREKNKYLGIEFEMNQKYADDNRIIKGIAHAFNKASERWINS